MMTIQDQQWWWLDFDDNDDDLELRLDLRGQNGRLESANRCMLLLPTSQAEDDVFLNCISYTFKMYIWGKEAQQKWKSVVFYKTLKT